MTTGKCHLIQLLVRFICYIIALFCYFCYIYNYNISQFCFFVFISSSYFIAAIISHFTLKIITLLYEGPITIQTVDAHLCLEEVLCYSIYLRREWQCCI